LSGYDAQNQTRTTAQESSSKIITGDNFLAQPEEIPRKEPERKLQEITGRRE